MNSTEAINRIVNLLGLKFKREKFFTTVLEDGQTQVTNNLEDELMVGQTLYVVGEATLSPAPAGKHTTREGIILTVDEESTILSIEIVTAQAEVEIENNENEVQMVRAEDAQGQILESPTFDVGEEVYVVGADGEMTPAPDGEHQVVLKDTEGNEVKIRIQTQDGKIVQRENVEEASADFSAQIEEIKMGITQLLGVLDSMNGKFKSEINSLKTDFEAFKNSPQRKPIEKKADFKESFEDFRVDFLKELRNK